jgi:uncharacterized membrane-anchored protein YhcB (DUF1043 family)
MEPWTTIIAGAVMSVIGYFVKGHDAELKDLRKENRDLRQELSDQKTAHASLRAEHDAHKENTNKVLDEVKETLKKIYELLVEGKNK